MKTKEQIIEEYGDIELSFSSYYKYNFNYSYSKDDLKIYGSFGGSSDSIYKYSCDKNKKILVKDYEYELHYLSVEEKGIEVFNYSQY